MKHESVGVQMSNDRRPDSLAGLLTLMIVCDIGVCVFWRTRECSKRANVQKFEWIWRKSVIFHRFRISLPASQVFLVVFLMVFWNQMYPMTFDLLLNVLIDLSTYHN